MNPKHERPHVRPRAEVDRRVLVYTVTFLLAAAGALGGLATLVLSQEPDASYISGRPWLAVLGPTRFGVEFITYGGDYTTVLYGILDENGNWVAWPSPIAPRFNLSVFPWDAVMVADPVGRVHVAWTLFDSDENVQSFHYVQLGPDSRIRVQVGPLGSAPVNIEAFGAPVSPGLLVTDQEVQVYWREVLSTGAAVYMKTTLDLSGRGTSQTTPVEFVDSAAYPSRVEFEGRTLRDSLASAGGDGRGNTHYLWQRQLYRGFTFNLFQEYDLLWRRAGSGGVVEKPIYSTWGWWWTTKAPVLPALVIMMAGLVAAPILSLRRRDWSIVRIGGRLKRRA